MNIFQKLTYGYSMLADGSFADVTGQDFVDRLSIGGIELRGTELRRLFGLRSTRLQISVSEDAVSFRSYGYGHRVGLSQYGARAMAEDGKSCEEILLYYYRGTELRKLQSLT